MGAPGAPIRLSFLLMGALAVACGPSVPVESLRSTETIVGRAFWNGQTALLTDAPALIVIDAEAARLSRRDVSATDSPLKPWGLAEDAGSLFTVSEFVDLVRIDASGKTSRVARFERPVANLFDLPSGMAGQYAAAQPGSSLAVHIGRDGALTALHSPLRKSLGLSSVEEEILHFLSCSAPPRVVCWLPNSATLFEMRNAALRAGVTLEGLHGVNPTRVVSGSAQRLIDDVIANEDGSHIVLHRVDDAAGRQGLTWFDRLGRPAERFRLEEPLRLLVAIDEKTVLALTKSGALARMNLE